jgi:hypothetical protein
MKKKWRVPGRSINFKRVRERDEICQKCGSETNLEVHHIIPLCDGGNNDMDNLITLCHQCHKYSPYKKEDFFKYLSIPLPYTFQLSEEILTYFYFEILEKIKKTFKIKDDFKLENNKFIHSTTINKDWDEKYFFELFDFENLIQDFMERKLISIVNVQKDKCKSYELWKKKHGRKI